MRSSPCRRKVALKVFADQERKFDLAFLDPPYAKQQMVKDMTALASLDLLKPGAKICRGN